MTTRLSVLLSSLCVGIAWAVTYPPGWEHADPPPGDEFLTNRFGRSWGEPVWTGHLIVNGQYVDAPYVVEQRGFVTLVNGVRVDDSVDIRLVLPLPPPPPVTEDPGFPTNITRDTPLGRALMNPTVMAKWKYWNHIGLTGEARTQAETNYLARLPCVARVEFPDASIPGRNIGLYDHQGKAVYKTTPGGPAVPFTIPSEPELYSRISCGRAGVEAPLKAGRLVLANNLCVGHEGQPPQPNERWRSIFQTLSSDLSGEEKLAALQKLGFVDSFWDLTGADTIFPITNFKPTPQLWKRLDGDESWKKDAEEMLRRLTNGWERIPPRFQREAAAVAVPTPKDAPPPKPLATNAPAASPRAVAPPSAPEPSPAPPPSESGRGYLIAILLVLVVGGIALAALRLARRRERQ